MVKPKNFGPNQDTLIDNSFQVDSKEGEYELIKHEAVKEFVNMVDVLRNHDIEIIVIDDTDEPIKPDSIFPNNWFSTHTNNSLVTYPMKAVSRRHERRDDIVNDLMEKYSYKKRYCFEYLEDEEVFLEGTGSMILDSCLLYTSPSPRDATLSRMPSSA